jgi:DNA-binding MarR family transcriptional regulator
MRARPVRTPPSPSPGRRPTERDFAWRGRSRRTQLQVETQLALMEAVTEQERDIVELLKPSELSLAQYNMLRVLRGAGPAGMTCGDVSGRLIKHDPDVTRLADRLEKRGLIARNRDVSDRRVVRTNITRAGLELLAALDEPLDALHERQVGHMTERQLFDLQGLIAALRTRRPG